MSNLDPNPEEIGCGSGGEPNGPEPGGATVEIITSRDVPLGGPRAMTVRRTLPQRQRSLIGAFCFVDHYGPDDVSAGGGMDVPSHPHTGLQTVSWLFEGNVTHHDSGDNHAVVRPGEVNLMTAGAGICHTEVSTQDTTVLHGVQLWTVLPDPDRERRGRGFDHHRPDPVLFPGGSALVFLGSLLGSSSSVPTHIPLVAAEIRLDPGAELRLDVDPGFEHGLLVDAGEITLEGVRVESTQLAYTGVGESALAIRNTGPTPARTILIGGTPFDEEIIMWWNFVGRTHEEIARYRAEWEAGSDRFGRVDGYIGHDPAGLTRLPAPTLPGTTLRPRANPDPRARATTPTSPTRRRPEMAEYTDKTGATVTVERSGTGQAFEIRDAAGEVAGHADFREHGGERIFHHTVVDERFGGRGMGTALVRGAVEATRAEGVPIVPVCTMVAGFLAKNSGEFAGAYRPATEEDRARLRGEDA